MGLGAVITQEGHLIAFASHALNPTERNYAQIEKECVTIVFATQKFEQYKKMYILGIDKVTVLTDHKPLTTIIKKQPKAITAKDASEAPKLFCQAVLQAWISDAHNRHPVSSIYAHRQDNPRDF